MELGDGLHVAPVFVPTQGDQGVAAGGPSTARSRAAQPATASWVKRREVEPLAGTRSSRTMAGARAAAAGTARGAGPASRQRSRAAGTAASPWRRRTHSAQAAASKASPMGRLVQSASAGAYDGSLIRSQWIQPTPR